MSYDPVADEKKPFAMAEFVTEAKDCLDEYLKALENQNDFTREPHTFDEWMREFLGFMSF